MASQSSNTDIELCAGGDLWNAGHSGHTRSRILVGLQTLLTCWRRITFRPSSQDLDKDSQGIQIEDYPKGYPRYAALTAAHDSFQVFRSFSHLRTRLLLLQQDQLVLLEKNLEKIDREEMSPLLLASSRRDRNEERQSLISEIRRALATYDKMLQRNSHILAFGAAHPKHVSSLRNWHLGNACIAREETEYLDRTTDLLSLSPPDDNVVSWLERYVSERLMCPRKRGRYSISRDPRVHIYARDITNRVARALLAPFIILLVVVPIIICNAMSGLTARLVIIVTAASVFITILSLFTKARTAELAVASATYATVLIVFISGPDSPPG